MRQGTETRSEGGRGGSVPLIETDFAEPGRIYRHEDGTLGGEFEISGEQVVLNGLKMNITAAVIRSHAETDSTFPPKIPSLQSYVLASPNSN